MTHVVVAAIVGGLCGGIGALFAHFASTRLMPGSRLQRTITGGATIAALTLGNTFVTPEVLRWWTDQQYRTPSQKYKRAMLDVVQHPAVASYLASVRNRGLTTEQETAEGYRIGIAGFARISDADLLRRADIISRGLSLVDPATCAHIAQGRQAEQAINVLLDAVGEKDAITLAGIAGRAMLAEVQQTPPARPPSTAKDADRLLTAVAEVASEKELAQITKAYDKSASDQDVCSGIQLLYKYAGNVPPNDQPRFCLMLTGM
jgi:hypothetical protein